MYFNAESHSWQKDPCLYESSEDEIICYVEVNENIFNNYHSSCASSISNTENKNDSGESVLNREI